MKIYIRSLVAAAAIIGAAPVCAVHAEGTEVVAPGETETPEIEWIEVSLESAGSLGVEVLYKVDKLEDVVNLRVSGPMNDQDWATLKNMSPERLDLSNASATAIPQSAFYNKSRLKSFLFPQGVASIGESAFYRTGLEEVEIPATVQSVSKRCFYECQSLQKVVWNSPALISAYCFYNCNKLTSVEIAEGVTIIGDQAFDSCDILSEIIIPSTLTKIGSSAFYNCNMLAEISFPQGLQTVGTTAFYNTALTKVILPDSLITLDGSAFNRISALTEVVLSSNIFDYSSYEFYDCPNIKKVTCRAATPPSIGGNVPFSAGIRSGCTLVVPDFAIVDYKLHDYWHNFGTIVGGVQNDSWTINSNLSLTNDRRIDGTPSIKLTKTGRMTVGGSAPMPMDDFSIESDLRNSNSYLGYAQLINNSPAMMAQSGSISLYTYSGRWYFITMPCDVKLSNVNHSAGGNFVFRYYDGEARGASASTGGSWKDVAADGTLEAGKAYIYQTDKEGNIVMTLEQTGLSGLLSNAHRETSVNAWASESASHAGWNLIGNPWLAYYDLYYTGLMCPVTLWNENNNNYTAYSMIDDNVVLKPMQAFFMQQADTDGVITFDVKGRQFTSEVSRPAAVRAKGMVTSGRSVFNIVIAGAESDEADRMRVVLNNDAAEEYEPARDAAKFFSDGSMVAELFSVDAEGTYLAINERPANGEQIAVGAYLPAAGKYTIKATRTDGTARLYDSMTGKYAELSAGEEYSFEADEKGYLLDRFYLALTPSASGIGMIEEANEIGSSCTIYTLDGKRVVVGSELIPGIYIVKEGTKVSKKIVK